MKAKQFKNRKSVPAKYKWDLDAILEGKTIDDLMKQWVKNTKQLIKIKESKYATKAAFTKSLKLEDETMALMFRIHNYVSNNKNGDISNPVFTELEKSFSFTVYKLDKEMGAEAPLVFKNEKKIREYLKDDKLKEYRKGFEDIFKTKKHQLPKAIQEFRIKESRADISANEIFGIITDSEIDFGYAKSSTGKKIKVTRANLTKLSQHKDHAVRKSASLARRDGYLKHKMSLSSLLYQHFKREVTWSELTNHKDIIDYLVFDDNASEKLLTSLYEGVQNNLDVFAKYTALQGKIYKSKFGVKMTPYDKNVPLVKVKAEYTVEEMQKEILKAFKPFGKEYLDQVKRAFKERWVDYMTIDNKRSGAYSIGASYPLQKKYILMNHDGSINSLETLAHELGHSLHSYFADTRNTIRGSQYKIFVAEIASIFNELMLFDHLLTTSDDDNLKFKIRQQMATGFESTVHRQILWSNYEYDLYKAIEKGEPVSTYEAISKIYYKNSLKYTTKNPKYKPEEQWQSIFVPHFYYGFYVYKYAIGQLVANIFFQKYKQEGKKALQTYIDKFLSVGGTLDPLDTLKNAGVDLEDPKVLELGFESARNNVKEMKKLAKKLFKI